MSLAFDSSRTATHSPRWGSLPCRLRVLFVSHDRRASQWLQAALATDSAVEVTLDQVCGATAGVERLRETRFDAVLVNHEPDELDALEFVAGLRAGGADEPAIILGSSDAAELAPLAFEVGADAYLARGETTTRLLLWHLARAYERHALIVENQRLALAEKQRLHTEHLAAERLLGEQRSLVRDLESLRKQTQAPDVEPPAVAASNPLDDRARIAERRLDAPSTPAPQAPELVTHYRELLRAYVMMGQGNLGAQMATLAELLAATNATTGEVMQLHLQVVEEIVRGIGTRSARHVLARADLLILEVMMHLGECYRQRRA